MRCTVSARARARLHDAPARQARRPPGRSRVRPRRARRRLFCGARQARRGLAATARRVRRHLPRRGLAPGARATDRARAPDQARRRDLGRVPQGQGRDAARRRRDLRRQARRARRQQGRVVLRVPHRAPARRAARPSLVRSFRFLASASAVVDARALAESARKAEALGYSALVITDHLLGQLAPVPFLATVAAATQRLRIGTFVFNNALRHPAVLAQDLASLDVLSGGRLEFGVGAGWNRAEYDAIGIAFDHARTRVERLAESVAILKGLFGPEPFSFAGKHYRIERLDGRPKPVQKPHPPFLIGGGGRRVLELAAREAQIVGLAPRIGARDGFASAMWRGTAEKIEWVRAAAGPRFDELELNTYPALGRVIVTDDARKAASEMAARIGQRMGTEVKPDDVLDSPHVFVGSIDGLVEKFQRLRSELGISCVMVGAMEPLAPVVERLAGT